MKIVPFSLLQTLELKDQQGNPWVPSRKDSLLIVPLGSIGLAMLFEATIFLTSPSENGGTEIGFNWVNVFRYLLYILLFYYCFFLPLFHWRRKAAMSHKPGDSVAGPKAPRKPRQ